MLKRKVKIAGAKHNKTKKFEIDLCSYLHTIIIFLAATYLSDSIWKYYKHLELV